MQTITTNDISVVNIHHPQITKVQKYDTFFSVELSPVNLFFESREEALEFAAEIITRVNSLPS